MTRILYVEDDVMVGKSTCQLLEYEKFQVDWAKTGLDALDLLFQQTYHLVLLDLGLPELDGIEVLNYIRHQMQDQQMGVIIISARDQGKDKVQGLRLGADDYLVKPYYFDELLARIESVLRRGHSKQVDEFHYAVADIQLFPHSHRLLKQGEKVELSTKEWTLLEVMMMHPNQVFSRDVLEQKLYHGDDEVSSNTIEVHIYHLRNKLGKNLIRTVRGLGYCIDRQNA